MLASWPAAGPTLAFLQLLLGPANAAFSGHLLLGILNPADELVTGQGRDVLPGIECRGIGDQRLTQVPWKPVHHPTGHSRAAHRGTVANLHGSKGVRKAHVQSTIALQGRRFVKISQCIGGRPERSIPPTHAECGPHRSHMADMPLHALRHTVARSGRRPRSDRAATGHRTRGTHRRDARQKARRWSQCQQRRSV